MTKLRKLKRNNISTIKKNKQRNQQRIKKYPCVTGEALKKGLGEGGLGKNCASKDAYIKNSVEHYEVENKQRLKKKIHAN